MSKQNLNPQKSPFLKQLMSKNLIKVLEATTIVSMAIGRGVTGYMMHKGKTNDVMMHYIIPSSFSLGLMSGLASEYIKWKN